MESPQYIDSSECPPACVTTDQLVLREELGLNNSVDLGLPLDILIEFPSDILQEFLHISVIGRDVSLNRCFVTIFLYKFGYFAVISITDKSSAYTHEYGE